MDKEGYYHVQHGELINKRYKVVSDIGRGVFSCVLECVDEKEGGARVAIKVIKNNHTMNKAAEKEVSILQRIASDVSPPSRLEPIDTAAWLIADLTRCNRTRKARSTVRRCCLSTAAFK